MGDLGTLLGNQIARAQGVATSADASRQDCQLPIKDQSKREDHGTISFGTIHDIDAHASRGQLESLLSKQSCEPSVSIQTPQHARRRRLRRVAEEEEEEDD